MNCWFRGPHWLLVEILLLKGKRKCHFHCCIVPFPSGTLAHHNLKTGPICFPFISEQTSENWVIHSSINTLSAYPCQAFSHTSHSVWNILSCITTWANSDHSLRIFSAELGFFLPWSFIAHSIFLLIIFMCSVSLNFLKYLSYFYTIESSFRLEIVFIHL